MIQLITRIDENGNNINGVLEYSQINNKKCIIFLPGFERSGTYEPKFKFLSNKFIELGYFTFRFDYIGIGLSNGNFKDFLVSDTSSHLQYFMNTIKSKYNIEKFHLVTHSLGAVIGSGVLSQFDKIILIAPALNQPKLNLYWFVKKYFKKFDSTKLVSWKNYEQLSRESTSKVYNLYLNYLKNTTNKTKYNIISSNYYLEIINNDYNIYYESVKDRVLLVHGLQDEVVPLESITIDFPNKLIVEDGDHDMDSLESIMQWGTDIIEYID